MDVKRSEGGAIGSGLLLDTGTDLTVPANSGYLVRVWTMREGRKVEVMMRSGNRRSEVAWFAGSRE